MKRTLGAITVLLAACSAPPTLMDSDIPQVPGLLGVQSIGVDRQDGRITRGTFVSRGVVSDALAQSNTIRGTAEANGWAVRGPDGTRHDARLEMTKDSRRVQYELRADRVDPDMGLAIVTVSSPAAAATGNSAPAK
ncbi:MAG: hypothetical protein FJ254_02140 [Phycisphaerae bacterium]|nr:hypothetical protein [Phycisphaerae bacterium]